MSYFGLDQSNQSKMLDSAANNPIGLSSDGLC